MSIWAVVPAAGTGSRMGGDLPKQYLELAGQPLLQWTLQALLACERIEGCAVALAIADNWQESVPLLSDPRVQRCVGGATRAASVSAAVTALPAADEDWVLVHDAARPCLPLASIDTLIDRVMGTETGGLLAQRQTDTLKRADAEGRVVETLPRAGLWRAQTPQMFRVGDLRSALDEACAAGVDVTDEASAMEFAGHPVQVVEGPACNLKVTFSDELAVAAQWLREHADPQANGGARQAQPGGRS